MPILNLPKSNKGRSTLIPQRPIVYNPEFTYIDYTQDPPAEVVVPASWYEADSDGEENGGRTWARMLSPIIGRADMNPSSLDEEPAEIAIGHGYSSSRTYHEECYGLLRALNGSVYVRKFSQFNIYWGTSYAGPWYYDPETELWTDGYSTSLEPPPEYYLGNVYGTYFGSIFPNAIHRFVQEEFEHALENASVITPVGPISITATYLNQYDTTENPDPVVLLSNVAQADYQVPPPAINVLGLTGVNV